MIFTFSTKDTKPEDAKVVADVKKYCAQTNRSFSGIIVTLLTKYKEEEIEQRRSKV